MRVWNFSYLDKRHGDNAGIEIGLDQNQRLALAGLAIADAADKQRGMRPGRLRQILDDAGNVIVAFDQQHVARLQGGAQSTPDRSV